MWQTNEPVVEYFVLASGLLCSILPLIVYAPVTRGTLAGLCTPVTLTVPLIRRSLCPSPPTHSALQMREVLAEEGDRAAHTQKALAETAAHAAFAGKVSKLHHLLSTSSQPGVFASPYQVRPRSLKAMF